jgi:drug/metabolite transporter (DMT)-like permease
MSGSVVRGGPLSVRSKVRLVASLGAPAGRSGYAPADVAQLALLGAIWGLTPYIIKTVVTTIPPLWLVAGRSLSGLAVVLLLARIRGRRFPRSGRIWMHFAVLGTIGSAFPWVVAAWAQQSLSSSLGAVLAAPIPATTLAIGAAVGVERLTKRRVVGIVLATTGTLATVGGELDGGGPVAALVALGLVTVMFGFGTVYAKRFLDDVPGLLVAGGQFVTATVVLVPVALLAGPVPAWGAIPALAWGLWLVLGAISTGWAFAVFYGLVGRIGPTGAQMTCYITPIVGAVAGWLLLRERIGVELVIGGLAILGGIWVSSRAGDRAVGAA